MGSGEGDAVREWGGMVVAKSVDRAAFGLPELTCCDLACYEDPGCACDGCEPPEDDPNEPHEAPTL